jgi:hypothetical protein
LKYQPLKEETLRKVGEITDTMWQTAVPAAHAYEIIPTAPLPKGIQNGSPANAIAKP